MASAHLTHSVTAPLCICDAFASERFKGNQAAVCLVPTEVYCMEWSVACSLEASFGRGEPDAEDAKMSEAERDHMAEKYTEDRNAKMGRAFLRIANEMNLSETAFVYRLPAARVRAIQQKIKTKIDEMEDEYEEKVRREERNIDNVPLIEEPVDTTQQHKDPQANLPLGIIPSASFSLGSFGESFLITQQALSGVVGGASKKPRRLNTQWFGLRWFSPKSEIPLCGHATFAAAHAIFETSRLGQYKATRHLVDTIPLEFFVPAQTDVLCFVTESGVISVRRSNPTDEAFMKFRDSTTAVESYEAHFPSNEAKSIHSIFPASLVTKLVAAIGLSGKEDLVADVAISASNGYYVVALKSAKAVFECKPDETSLRAAFECPEFVAALEKHPKELREPHGLIVTAENNKEILAGNGGDAEIISRFFTPWYGILEDPVTGSMYAAILPYWLHRRQGSYKVGDKLQFYQASSRGGSVTGIIIGKKAERVALVGSVVTFLRGHATFQVED